jgi:hypothetical protein
MTKWILKLNVFYIFAATLLTITSVAFSESEELPEKSPKISLDGFAEFSLTYENYPEYFYRDRFKGGQRDHRFSAKISTLSVGVDCNIDTDVRTHAEIAFKHGGIASEHEPNYLGPFSDIHGGQGNAGAVSLTQIFFSKDFGKNFVLAVGRLPVAFGYQFENKSPISYLGAEFWQTESHIIPEEWTELGISMRIGFASLESTTQILNGLDSSGFGSRRWIAEGRQGRFGSVSMSDPAFVERIDLNIGHIFRPGFGVYYGETSRNRPTADLARRCPSTAGSDKVAPCGYTPVPVTIVDFHMALDGAGFRSRFEFLGGTMEHAENVNLANAQDQSNLPELYTPVASEAFGVVSEIGYELATANELSVTPFIIYEHFDTMLVPVTVADDNPIYDRRRIALGTSVVQNKNQFLKIELSQLGFGDARIKQEGTGELVAGFIF